MIKAAARDQNGKLLVILGLSEGNVAMLKKNRPMAIDLKPFGIDASAVIMYGVDEQAITRELAKHFKLPV